MADAAFSGDVSIANAVKATWKFVAHLKGAGTENAIFNPQDSEHSPCPQERTSPRWGEN